MTENRPDPPRPSIDHSLLSPSGRMSKRARAAALKREYNILFPPGYLDKPLKSERQKAEDKAAGLLRAAANLRELAARGMSSKRYTRQAAKLEAEARALFHGEAS